MNHRLSCTLLGGLGLEEHDGEQMLDFFVFLHEDEYVGLFSLLLYKKEEFGV